MNKLDFENTYYEEPLDLSKRFSKTKENGYCNLEVTENRDQILIQQNNTIIALLASLHHRLTLLENKLLQVETQIQKTTQATKWKESIDNLTKDLSKLST